MKSVIQFMLLLSACNTWERVKKDSSEAGKATAEAAEKAGKAIQEATE